MNRSWWARATSPALFSAWSLIGFTLIGTFAIITTIPTPQISIGARVAWLGVALVAQASVIVIVLIGRVFLRSSVTPTVRVLRVVIVALAGAVRGILVQLVSAQVGLEDPSAAVGRIVNSSYTTVIWMVILAIIIDAHTSYQREYRTLFERDIVVTARVELDDLDGGDTSPAEDVEETMRTWSADVRERVSRLRRDDGMLPPDVARDMVNDTAEAIRELVTTRVRPLSHRLWFGAQGQPPRVRFGPVVLEAFRQGPLMTWQVAALLIAGLSLGSLVRYGAQVVAVSGPALALSLGLSAYAGHLWMRHATASGRTPNALLWNALTLLPISVFAAVSSMGASYVLLGAGADLPTMFTLIIGIPLLAIAIGVARVTFADRQELLAVMRDEDAVRDAVRRIREREVATYLHNHVKSQLTAGALRLREASTSTDPDAVRAAADTVLEVLARPIPDAIMLGRQSPKQRLEEVVASWQGIADVDLHVPDGLDDATVLMVSDVVAEAVANAVRNGGAGHIEVVAIIHDSLLRLTIADDGAHTSDRQASGLGTAWLDTMVPGRWHLKQSTHGSTLRVDLPLP